MTDHANLSGLLQRLHQVQQVSLADLDLAQLPPPSCTCSSNQDKTTTPLQDLRTARTHREAWGQLRTRRRIQRTIQSISPNAGPLNSQALVARSLTVLQDLSPTYLSHFLGWVDCILWLEGMDNTHSTAPMKSAPTAKNAPAASGATKGRTKKR
ncbi:Hypothetical protein HDN1F_27850 [gamma proteobacterium HdN1]|nr:Hypothetical protein HDN1F_27850 [gamma proteobacterium HdN1]